MWIIRHVRHVGVTATTPTGPTASWRLLDTAFDFSGYYYPSRGLDLCLDGNCKTRTTGDAGAVGD